MKQLIKISPFLLAFILLISSCKKDDYKINELEDTVWESNTASDIIKAYVLSEYSDIIPAEMLNAVDMILQITFTADKANITVKAQISLNLFTAPIEKEIKFLNLPYIYDDATKTISFSMPKQGESDNDEEKVATTAKVENNQFKIFLTAYNINLIFHKVIKK